MKTASICYLASIVIINMAFEYIPPVILPDGSLWSIGSILAGAVFVVRDYAQREVGHRVLLLMFIAGVMSYILASPFVAMASLLAFGFSELVDYIVYSTHKGTFRQRVVLSSVLSVPVDTVIFLSVINHLSAVGFVTMVASKMAAVLFVLWREKQA